jgi:hypothetical protein
LTRSAALISIFRLRDAVRIPAELEICMPSHLSARKSMSPAEH